MDGASVRAGDPFFYAASRRLKGEQRDQEQEHPEQEQERRNCFFCLEGWVFLGSLDHDGEEADLWLLENTLTLEHAGENPSRPTRSPTTLRGPPTP